MKIPTITDCAWREPSDSNGHHECSVEAVVRIHGYGSTRRGAYLDLLDALYAIDEAEEGDDASDMWERIRAAGVLEAKKL